MVGGTARKITLWVVVGLIVVAFVAFYGGSAQRAARGGHGDTVASIDGENIPLEIFRVYRRSQEDQEQRLRDLGLKTKDIQEALDRQILNFLVQQTLLAHHSRDLGFRVTDEELRKEICSNPAMLENGRCDPKRLSRLRQAQGFDTERSYVSTLRRELLVQKLVRFLDESIRVSDDAARDQLRRERTTLQLDYVALRADDFRGDVKVSDEESAAFAKAQADRVREAYELRISEFKRPEQIRLRQIVFTGDKAEEDAEAARAKLEGGDDFAKLAKELSKDPATAPAGGDLGFLSQDQMRPEFGPVVAAGEANKVLGPVKTEQGVHLLRIEERRPALDVSLEQATPQLAKDLLTVDRASERARQRAEQLSAAVTSGKNLKDAAKELGLNTQQTPQFNTQVRAIPGLDPVPGLRETALSLRADSPPVERIFGEKDVFYLIALAERNEPKPEELTAELEGARERLVGQMRNQLENQLYQSLLQQAEKDGEIHTYGLQEGEAAG